MAQLNIDLQFELRESEPDGGTCLACGDVVYLKAYDLVARLGKARTAITAGTLCQSCAEMFEAGNDLTSDPPP